MGIHHVWFSPICGEIERWALTCSISCLRSGVRTYGRLDVEDPNLGNFHCSVSDCGNSGTKALGRSRGLGRKPLEHFSAASCWGVVVSPFSNCAYTGRMKICWDAT